MLPALTEAEINELTIIELAKNYKLHYLEMGGFLADNQDRALWSEHHESFRDFVEHLGIGSYSCVTRLINVSRVVAAQLLSKEDVMEIGVGKTCLLLPRLKDGRVSEDIVELAKNCTEYDLRVELGHKTRDEESEEYLLCPRCGAEIIFRKDMLRRR